MNHQEASGFHYACFVYPILWIHKGASYRPTKHCLNLQGWSCDIRPELKEGYDNNAKSIWPTPSLKDIRYRSVSVQRLKKWQ